MKTVRYVILALLAGLPLHAAITDHTQHLRSPEQTPQGLAKSDWQSIREAYETGRHTFAPAEGGCFVARNPGQQMRAVVNAHGFTATVKGADWQWGLELTRFGWAGREEPPHGSPRSVTAGQKFTRTWDDGLEEWYVNDSSGLEHGFTVPARPDGATGGALSFVLAVRGDLQPEVEPAGQAVRFIEPGGGVALTYGGLKVWDANGDILSARMMLVPSGVKIEVEEAGARYPLTVDPVVQQGYLKPAAVGTTQAGDGFGTAVAVSGDTVVVGAKGEDSGTTGVNRTPDESAPAAGAAYVFVRSGTTWTQQAYLKASNTGAGDQFGCSVAVSGDTVIIGAIGEDSNGAGVNNESAPNAGAAYVFTRSGATWTQQAYLKEGNPTSEDFFGTSVAVSGDIVVAGAPGEDNSGTDIVDRMGVAYIFARTGTTWTQQADLKASNIWVISYFGNSVAVSGQTVVVGAYGERSSTTGVNSIPNTSAVSAGAAYIFIRNGTIWTQQAYLKAGNTGANDQFGWSVAVSGDTVVVGAPQEASSTTGVNSTPNESAPGSGAAYIFTRSGSTWMQQAYLKAANTEAGDNFGFSVAVSGDVVLAGAYQEASSTTGVNSTPNESAPWAGAAYIFTRSGTAWAQQDYLKAGNTGAGDQFGRSVAVSGDIVIVGASGEDSSTTGINSTPNESGNDAGTAYIFSNQFAEIAIEQPAGTDIPGGGSKSFGTVTSGSPVDLTFTIRNTGNLILNLTGNPKVAVSGPDAVLFTVTTQPASPVAAGSATTFSVRFAPASGGARTATLTIANDDNDEGTFIINCTGTGLSFTTDTDGDGLNDAAEFQMAALGFDWEVAQPVLVNTLFANANSAELYTRTQVQALNVGVPLLTRDANSNFKLTIGIQKSNLLGIFVPFPFVPVQTTINGSGNIEFQFASPDDAAFFRVESK